MNLSDFSNVPWICAKRWEEKASKIILKNTVFFECLFKALNLLWRFTSIRFCGQLKSSPHISVN